MSNTTYEIAKEWWFNNVPFDRKLDFIDECFSKGIMLPLSKSNIIKLYRHFNPQS